MSYTTLVLAYLINYINYHHRSIEYCKVVKLFLNCRAYHHIAPLKHHTVES
jgi:hypothetical protein